MTWRATSARPIVRHVIDTHFELSLVEINGILISARPHHVLVLEFDEAPEHAAVRAEDQVQVGVGVSARRHERR